MAETRRLPGGDNLDHTADAALVMIGAHVGVSVWSMFMSSAKTGDLREKMPAMPHPAGTPCCKRSRKPLPHGWPASRAGIGLQARPQTPPSKACSLIVAGPGAHLATSWQDGEQDSGFNRAAAYQATAASSALSGSSCSTSGRLSCACAIAGWRNAGPAGPIVLIRLAPGRRLDACLRGASRIQVCSASGKCRPNGI